MQAVKLEMDSSESYSGDDALLLAVSTSPFAAKSACRRKREFIPDERKDTVYWERRRKNNEAAKRSREKRRINDMVLENKLMALGEENSSLRAELLSLKLKFGLLTSAAYDQEVEKLSGRTGARLYGQFVPAGEDRDSSGRGPEPPQRRASCISVIKHSPCASKACATTQGGSRSAEVKREPTETGAFPREGSSPYELLRNYMAGSLSRVCAQPATFPRMARSSSNSPGSSDDGAVSKSSDGEDEQRVPKGLLSSERSVIVSAHKVPEAASSALPHKLRIKAKTVQIKVEAVDPEYESSPGSERFRAWRFSQSSSCPLSEQVTAIQDWTGRPEQWDKNNANMPMDRPLSDGPKK
ncbi:nuclear factor interleukin-3-regulated protein [Stigmatopora argus]